MRPPQPTRSTPVWTALWIASSWSLCEKRFAGRGAPCDSRPGLVDGCTSMPTFATTASFFWLKSPCSGAHAGWKP